MERIDFVLCPNVGDPPRGFARTFALSLFALFLAGHAANAADTPATNDPGSMDWRTFASTPANATGPDADKVRRGKYLVTIAGCNDCHTPLKAGPNGPEPDMSRMLSGHPEAFAVATPAAPPAEPWLVTVAPTSTAYSGPWGVSFTANLTPDVDTGIGQWTLRNFKDTIRSGRHLGRGRAVLPPMPIAMYRHMTDDDLEAVYTYLRTIPPVKNRVPEPLPPAQASTVADAGQ